MKKLVFVLLFGLSINANAIVEIRAGYGLGFSGLDATNAYSLYSIARSTVPDVGAVSGFNFDAIFNIPAIPIGFGARYSLFGASGTNGASGYDLTANRLALVVNWRFINTLIYLGAIGTYGISHTVENTFNGTDTDVANDTSSFQIGVEGGVTLGTFLIGAEVGYQTFKGSNWTVGGSPPSTPPEWSNNGLYGIVHLGISI